MTGRDLAALREELEDQLVSGERRSLIPTLTKLVEGAGSGADVDLLRSLAICLDETGEPQQAVKYFRAVLAIEPKDPIARNRVARLERPQALRPARAASRAGARNTQRRSRTLASHDEAKHLFLLHFPKTFHDPKYLEEERDYKWQAHKRWEELLSRPGYEQLIATGDFTEICRRLLVVNGKLNLLSVYESAALGDATKTLPGARLLAEGIFQLVYGGGDFGPALDALVAGLHRLNIQGTPPVKWPILTLFPFVADPIRHFFLKPAVTQQAAERFGFTLNYRTQPNGLTYQCALDFAHALAADMDAWRPRDNIDIQSFVWVTNSAGYG